MKNRNIIFTVVVFLLLLPLVLIPLSFFVVEFIVGQSFGDAWSRAWESLMELSMIEYIGLHSAVTGIVVILCFPFAFSKLHKIVGKHRQQEEFHRKKQMLYDILHSGIAAAMKSRENGSWNASDFMEVTDNHIHMVSEMDSLFSEKQSSFLRQVLELLKSISEQAKQEEVIETKQSVEKLVKLVSIPNDQEHLASLQNDRGIDERLNGKSRTILQLLSEETEEQTAGSGSDDQEQKTSVDR